MEKPLKEHLGKYQKRYIALLIAILLYVLFNAGDGDIDTIFEKARTLSVTFVWLLAAIVAALRRSRYASGLFARMRSRIRYERLA